MLRFDASLFSLAAQFTGKYAPCQGVTVSPLVPGDATNRIGRGVVVTASDRGAATFLALDPQGTADEEAAFIPDDELIKAARGIKTAARELLIEEGRATVTTFRKTTSESKEFPVHRTQQRLPDLPGTIARAVEYWSATPELTTTAGRYDLQLLHKAIRAMVDDTDSIVISAFQGGPLRLQREDTGVVVLLMPQTARPIPPMPAWLLRYAQVPAAADTACQG